MKMPMPIEIVSVKDLADGVHVTFRCGKVSMTGIMKKFNEVSGPAKPKRKRRTKAEMQAALKAANPPLAVAARPVSPPPAPLTPPARKRLSEAALPAAIPQGTAA